MRNFNGSRISSGFLFIYLCIFSSWRAFNVTDDASSVFMRTVFLEKKKSYPGSDISDAGCVELPQVLVTETTSGFSPLQHTH